MSIFIRNKYHSWYYNIINSAKSQERIKLKRGNSSFVYYENHHIIPKSLGSSNDKDNLVLLTAREHFICHILLPKFVTPNSPSYHKMIRAAHNMTRNSKTQGVRYINSRLYQTIKSQFSKTQSISQTGESNSQYGKKKSLSSKSKISTTLKLSHLKRRGISKKFNISSGIISKYSHKNKLMKPFIPKSSQDINKLLEYYILYNSVV